MNEFHLMQLNKSRNNVKHTRRFCSYKGCSSDLLTTQNGAISFFGFPMKDTERCSLWITNCGREEFRYLTPKELQERRICELHFERKMFSNEFKSRLKKQAIPMSCITEIIEIDDDEEEENYDRVSEGNESGFVSESSISGQNNNITTASNGHVNESSQVNLSNNFTPLSDIVVNEADGYNFDDNQDVFLPSTLLCGNTSSLETSCQDPLLSDKQSTSPTSAIEVISESGSIAELTSEPNESEVPSKDQTVITSKSNKNDFTSKSSENDNTSKSNKTDNTLKPSKNYITSKSSENGITSKSSENGINSKSNETEITSESMDTDITLKSKESDTDITIINERVAENSKFHNLPPQNNQEVQPEFYYQQCHSAEETNNSFPEPPDGELPLFVQQDSVVSLAEEEAPSEISEPVSKKRKRDKDDDFAGQIKKHMNNSIFISEDEFEIFGKSVAVQLKKMSLCTALTVQAKIQQLLSEHRINDIRKKAEEKLVVSDQNSEANQNKEKEVVNDEEEHLVLHVSPQLSLNCASDVSDNEMTEEQVR